MGWNGKEATWYTNNTIAYNDLEMWWIGMELYDSLDFAQQVMLLFCQIHVLPMEMPTYLK